MSRTVRGLMRASVLVAVAIVAAVRPAAAAIPPVHHWVWDATDREWRCLGTEIDCMTDAET